MSFESDLQRLGNILLQCGIFKAISVFSYSEFPKQFLNIPKHFLINWSALMDLNYDKKKPSQFQSILYTFSIEKHK